MRMCICKILLGDITCKVSFKYPCIVYIECTKNAKNYFRLVFEFKFLYNDFHKVDTMSQGKAVYPQKGKMV